MLLINKETLIAGGFDTALAQDGAYHTRKCIDQQGYFVTSSHNAMYHPACYKFREWIKRRWTRRQTGQRCNPYRVAPPVVRKLLHKHSSERKNYTRTINRCQKQASKLQDKLDSLNAELQRVKSCQVVFYQQNVEPLPESDAEHEVTEQDTNELIPLLHAVMKKAPEWLGSFNYLFIRQQLECILAKDGRGIRWNPALLDFTMSLQYYGGQRVLDLMRGSAYGKTGKRCGKLCNKASNFNIFLPSNSTVRGRTPFVSPYEDETEAVAAKIKHMCSQRGITELEGGIVSDEIEIRYGFVYLKSSGVLVGGIEELSVLDLDPLKPIMEYESCLAKKVCQFFFISNSGDIALPFGFYPTVAASGKWMANVIGKKIEALKRHGIHVSWGSTDGFQGSATFVRVMKERYSEYVHFFDYIHTVKGGRNSLIGRTLYRRGSQFNMNSIYKLWVSCPDKVGVDMTGITFEDIHPSDKQCLKKRDDSFPSMGCCSRSFFE